MQVGQREFDMLVPADPDAFLNQLEEADQKGEPEPDVYWAAMWPAAIPTATAMLHSHWPPETRVLELGTGIGLPGIAAAARGYSVTLSDYVPLSVDLAVENARRNGLGVQGLVLDWREPQDKQFPRILGADVLYDASRHDDLLNVLDKMLAKDGECWIGEPGRYHFQNFIRNALSRGFQVHYQDETGKPKAEATVGDFQIVVLRRER